MKTITFFLFFIFSISTVLAQDFYLNGNGVTCMCPDANIGESGDPGNGIIYTKRSADDITVQNAATTCTSGVSGIVPNWFTGDTTFNEDISSWDVSNFENMTNFLSGCTSFNQDLGNWQFQYWILMLGLLDNTGLSVENYDSFISNLIGQNIAPTTIGVDGLIFCDETSRNMLLEQGWAFEGDQPKDLYFEAPGDIILSLESTPCEVSNIELGEPIFSGCEPIQIENDAPADFPVGETLVTWTMIDGNQNEFVNEQIVSIELTTDEAAICYVSADPDFVNKNRIYGTQNSDNPNFNVFHHEVLKETSTSGQFEIIGYIVPPDNYFIDSTSDNTLQSHSYKIQTIDICGIAHTDSDIHKTVLLQSNVGQNNTVNLIWNYYEGLSVSSYFIYRSTNGGEFELITQISGSNNAYNDNQTNVIDNFYEYYLAFQVSDCLTDPFTVIYARSNNEYINPNLLVPDNNLLDKIVWLYPIPAMEYVNIVLKSGIELESVEFFSTLGQRIMKTNGNRQINISELKPGVYYLNINTNQGVVTKTLVRY